MKADDLAHANQDSRDAWNQNASYWDQRMGEGNAFVEWLIWPAVTRLLEVQPGQRILDIACGNGLTSRRMAAAGAHVVAIDFAEEMLMHARERTVEHADQIEYRMLDATDEAALGELGEHSFDAALCNMALFDMADIKPLVQSLPKLIRPTGKFVFSITHPAFNGGDLVRVQETDDREGKLVTRHAIKVYAYKHFKITQGVAMRDQPVPQPYFHRSLEEIFNLCFQQGFVIDGFEEPTFPADQEIHSSWYSWGKELPPVLVARARLLG